MMEPMRYLPVAAALTVLLAAAGPGEWLPPALAQDAGFDRFVEKVWPSAKKAGVSRSTFRRAFKGVAPDPEVLKKAEYQPEFTKPIWVYLASAVSDKRIENGRAMVRKYRSVLSRLEAAYGVDRHIIIAIIQNSFSKIQERRLCLFLP